jgi:hypothetical protein
MVKCTFGKLKCGRTAARLAQLSQGPAPFIFDSNGLRNVRYKAVWYKWLLENAIIREQRLAEASRGVDARVLALHKLRTASIHPSCHFINASGIEISYVLFQSVREVGLISCRNPNRIGACYGL